MKAAHGVALLLGLAVLAALALPWQRQRQARATGAALYGGVVPLVARLEGHAQPLPPQATRCLNCHDGAQATGPALVAATLTQALPRRGGPPSRYDAARLCQALRRGVDPALVTLARAMPRYELADGECAALWAFVSQR